MVTLLIFIIILGAIIFIHESGHFLFAKLTGIYVHEFALGMGPKLISHKGKETTYSLRLIPIGGFCQLAGEEGEEENIPKERTLQGKKAWQRFLVMFFGAGFNFISAILMLFFIGLIFGSVDSTPLITSVNNNSRILYFFNKNIINLQTIHLKQKTDYFLFSSYSAGHYIVLLSKLTSYFLMALCQNFVLLRLKLALESLIKYYQ